MPALESYALLLQGLAAQAGLDAGQLLASEEIVIDGVAVALSQAGACLQCVCEVAQLPLEPPQELLHLLLQANTLGAPTRGATLGLLASRDALVLARRIPLDSSAQLAARTCRDLAAMSVLWAAVLPQT
ncbi:type III secretion system chaperone [Comamonas endophytica]|uniref:Type III secretion system chaperone n=1 Tax=Comamonas endophytica TaxID=2949090 RepID=A0ABY6G959_9BURK|nr:MULTISPECIES: type III secretion system chaperone [unclassified Acidovorax]MCD2511727.1 type III secretion system chaperone [Acidovorax sp. D4N7]UYG51453.1 type III secretion system chaperone [Acidovorax sp. 5MLIR]